MQILIVCGPTATGKTELAVKLAKRYNGALIACDSRQVYKGLKIGAGKGSESVSMYDVANPAKLYSVSDYVKQARKVLKNIWEQGKLPIVVGGTGLYLKALLGEITNINIPPNNSLRELLEDLSLEELQNRVVALSPAEFKKMNFSEKRNKRRLIRKIEILSTNPYIDITDQNINNKTVKYDTLKIGLSAPRPILYKRIDSRVESRLDLGMVEEVKLLHKRGLSYKRMRQLGLEYGIIALFLQHQISEKEMIITLKNKIHQYAKRQLTWFKKDPHIIWFDITVDYEMAVDSAVQAWYDPRV